MATGRYISKAVLVLAIVVGLAFGWRQSGKPGLSTLQKLKADISMSLPWRDFVFSRTLTPGAPAPYPQAADIPLGSFYYGCKPGRDVAANEVCPEDEAGREVDLRERPRPCTAMGTHEVTYLQYDYYVWSQRHLPTRERPPYPEAAHGERGARPVVNVSHDDALGYVRWLSQVTQQTWRLPSEEEWEYAARAVHPDKAGGKHGPWWWGDEPPSINGRADCNGCDTRSDGTTAPVGSFKPNPFGIYDTVGNVSVGPSSV